ncbi:hypothetical protein GVAV_002145 [Gurleya vavrai]
MNVLIAVIFASNEEKIKKTILKKLVIDEKNIKNDRFNHFEKKEKKIKFVPIENKLWGTKNTKNNSKKNSEEFLPFSNFGFDEINMKKETKILKNEKKILVPQYEQYKLNLNGQRNFNSKFNRRNRLCNEITNALICCSKELTEAVRLAVAFEARSFLLALDKQLTDASLLLSNSLSALNTSLNSTIAGLISTNNSNEILGVQNIITTSNNNLLQSVSDLILLAVNSTTVYVQNLATLSPIAIENIVLNLTLPGGLLPTLLSIFNSLDSSINLVFSNATSLQLSAIAAFFNQSNTLLQNQITDAVSANNVKQLQAVNTVILAQTAPLTALFNQFVQNLLNSVKREIEKYDTCSRNTLVKILGCNDYERNCLDSSRNNVLGLRTGNNLRNPLNNMNNRLLCN